MKVSVPSREHGLRRLQLLRVLTCRHLPGDLVWGESRSNPSLAVADLDVICAAPANRARCSASTTLRFNLLEFRAFAADR